MKKDSTTKATQPTEELRVLKTATCPSLSGKSTLTYHVGCNASNAIHFRVVANTGKGFFNKDWTPQEALEKLLSKVPASSHITSGTFHPICKGKSVNTAGFLLAVLQSEGLIQPAKDSPRCYERVETNEFSAAIQSLIESGTETLESDRPAPKPPTTKAPKKAVAKKPDAAASSST